MKCKKIEGREGMEVWSAVMETGLGQQPAPRLWRPPLGPSLSSHRPPSVIHHHSIATATRQTLSIPTTHVSRLFPELLALIFSWLDVPDKGRAAQTCAAWREAAYSKSVWRGVEARLHLRRNNPSLFPSLVRRGIKRVQILSLRRSLKEVVVGLPDLESLNLSGCYNLTDTGLAHALSSDLLKLKRLDLSLCKQVTDTSLGRIAQYLKNLETLELGGCSSITDTGLLLIGWGLRRLRRLGLRSCWHVGDRGISHLISEGGRGTPCLEYLALQDCQRLTDESLKHIAKLTELKYLNLSFCVSITDGGLKHLAKMSNLQVLNLRACDNISDIGVGYLAEGGSSINTLDVSFCDKVGDQALTHASQGLFKLKSLSLSACPITDVGLDRIAKSLPELESLHIGQCNRITDKGLNNVAESLLRLRSIDLYGCVNISQAGLRRLSNMPHLSCVNLGLWTAS